MNRFRLHRPSPAMIVALVALFVAMGGVGYAAFRLPNNSVGSKQIKANAVNSGKVKNGSLLAGDFKAGQLPAGPKGDTGSPGPKGDACLPADAACRGPKGDAGSQGPGALSFDGQFPIDGIQHNITVTNGIRVAMSCDAGISEVVAAPDFSHAFYGWGTQSADGGAVSHAAVSTGSSISPDGITVSGASSVELDVVAHSTATGEAVKWTRVDVLGVRGGMCNYHALVIPPS
jgi:hypothetical protein